MQFNHTSIFRERLTECYVRIANIKNNSRLESPLKFSRVGEKIFSIIYVLSFGHTTCKLIVYLVRSDDGVIALVQPLCLSPSTPLAVKLASYTDIVTALCSRLYGNILYVPGNRPALHGA